MRGTAVSSLARVELSGLCASCARKRLASSILSRPLAASTPRTFSTRTRSDQTPRSPTTSSSRRWLSTSRALRSGQDSTQTEEPASTQRPKTEYTPLPYYALFPQTLPEGPPPTGPFYIDARALRREFLQLQAASHPDFHHSAAGPSPSTAETDQSPSHSSSRRKAEALSSHINSAYKTLSDPLSRAQYLLAERYGVDLAGDEASRLTGPPDPSLLIEVLHARETIEDAASEKDLDDVRAENEERIDRCLAGLAEAFAAEDLAAAVRETVRLRYWVNIRESIQNWEEGKPIVLEH